jgi:hypothetical protein
MYTECSRDGCTAKALWAPKLCCPVQNMPASLDSPYSLFVDLPLCNDHFEELSPTEWLEGKMQAKELMNIISLGRSVFRKPDFDRAYFVRISLIGDEYRKLNKLRDNARTGN